MYMVLELESSYFLLLLFLLFTCYCVTVTVPTVARPVQYNIPLDLARKMTWAKYIR
jgi:hypothetical protein